MIRPRGPVWITAVLALVSVAAGFAQQVSSPHQGPSVAPQAFFVNAQELVQRAVANEVNSDGNNDNFMFRVRRQTPKGTQTREYVETEEGTAGMLVAVDDRALTTQQRQQEFVRLEQLLHNPAELRRKLKQQKEDSARVTRMVKSLPDAFRYEYAGTEAVNGVPVVRLKFEPNPDFDPPSREQQVFTGMQGFLLIEPHRARIARIDGTLFKDVGFGWGILGHLDRGGRFVVVQGPVANGYWTTTHMQLSFTGKALFFKTINIQTTEDSSAFRRVPAHLTFAQGVELLRKQREGVLADNEDGTRK